MRSNRFVRPVLVVAFFGAALLATEGALTQSAAPAAYKAPRTPWGDPDVQGKWPGTRMVGVPMQRDEKRSADSYTDRSNYDRCITRGLSGSILQCSTS